MVLYGIPNCDSVRRARAWLGARGIEHEFHDFKKAGVPAVALESWVAALGWQPLVNRQGSTWRKLDAGAQQAVVDARSAQTLMQAHASLIKRPVVVWDDGEISVGFDEPGWATRLGRCR